MEKAKAGGTGTGKLKLESVHIVKNDISPKTVISNIADPSQAKNDSTTLARVTVVTNALSIRNHPIS